MRANYQLNRIDRIESQLQRSDVGPSLLHAIKKKNLETKDVLKDLSVLDDKLENPQKYEDMRK